MHEDQLVASGEDNVGTSRKISAVEPKAVAQPVQQLAHPNLGLGIGSPDESHSSATLRGRDDVRDRVTSSGHASGT